MCKTIWRTQSDTVREMKVGRTRQSARRLVTAAVSCNRVGDRFYSDRAGSICYISLVIQISNAPAAVDAEALRRELEACIEGEVRFDTISRALYSTDASVYQIRPLGVVIPKNREDILRALEICRRHRCPLTMRGGGTSQAGQAIGEGMQVDTSKYLQPRARSERGGALGARRAGHRAG